MTVANLDTVRARIGTVSNVSNTNLKGALDAATAHAEAKNFMAGHFELDDVQEGIILLTIRLYKRPQSPEGVAGWGDVGIARIVSSDPDINRLWEPHLDYCHAGIA